MQTRARPLNISGGDRSGATESITSPAAGSLTRLADLSLAAYLRQLALHGGVTVEEDGLLLFMGAHAQPNPYRNGALRLTDQLSAEEVMRRAERFFSGQRSSYCLWAREHGDRDLEAAAAGMQELERLPEMVLEELPTPLLPPEGVTLRRALDDQTRQDYLEVVANAWGMRGMPLDVAARVFFDPAGLDAPGVVAFVAYYGGQPLSGAMTLVTHGVALGCQAATIRRARPGQTLPPPAPPHERRGLADSCLWAALRVSFEELGARVSLCQSSGAGAPVWLRLGYVPFTGYARYLVQLPAGAPRARGGQTRQAMPSLR